VSSQVTVRMPPELAERLDRAAAAMRRSRSDVVRLALERFLEGGSTEQPAMLVRDLVGSVESGLPDLGRRHREYLIERLRHAR